MERNSANSKNNILIFGINLDLLTKSNCCKSANFCEKKHEITLCKQKKKVNKYENEINKR